MLMGGGKVGAGGGTGLGGMLCRGDWSQVRERGQAHRLVWEMKCHLALT